MGRSPRLKPARLAEKLRYIRDSLELSQDEMLGALGLSDEKGMFRSVISHYELGKRDPPLPILLAYARIANVYVEALMDDGIDLPIELPAAPKSEGFRRITMPRPQPSNKKPRTTKKNPRKS